jgi:hypothetical protein
MNDDTSKNTEKQEQQLIYVDPLDNDEKFLLFQGLADQTELLVSEIAGMEDPIEGPLGDQALQALREITAHTRALHAALFVSPTVI